ncbi:MAG: hypothetical protein Q8880_10000, partial [Bacteroidota bacterium]|nr:hypothetical protein [Bacteroidota bacterium]
MFITNYANAQHWEWAKKSYLNYHPHNSIIRTDKHDNLYVHYTGNYIKVYDNFSDNQMGGHVLV